MTIATLRSDVFSRLAAISAVPIGQAVAATRASAPTPVRSTSVPSKSSAPAMPAKSAAQLQAERGSGERTHLAAKAELDRRAQAERESGQRAHLAAKAEQQRQAAIAAETEKAQRKAAADAVWSRINARHEAELRTAQGLGPAPQKAEVPAATDHSPAAVWARAHAKNADMRGQDFSRPEANSGSASAEPAKSNSVWARAYASNHGGER